MSKLLRYYSKGQIYFITIVTYQRQEILITHFDLLWNSMQQMIAKHDVKQSAWVVLPDHLHMILAPKGNDLSQIIHNLKLSFGSHFRKNQNLSSGRVWQNRFWDHIIRDQDDLNRHIDYIHYNPINHRLVKDLDKWRYSSFSEYKELGYYQDDLGIRNEIKFDGEYGE